jgi:hypothetical protein
MPDGHGSTSCKYGKDCYSRSCDYQHPRERKAPCRYGKDCRTQATCKYGHPHTPAGKRAGAGGSATPDDLAKLDWVKATLAHDGKQPSKAPATKNALANWGKKVKINRQKSVNSGGGGGVPQAGPPCHHCGEPDSLQHHLSVHNHQH